MFFLIVRSVIPAEPTLSASVSQWAYRGISYVAYWRDLYSSPESDQSLALLAATGANAVSIIVTCYQETVSSTQIQCLTDSSTPTDDDLRHVIAQAHQLGLDVMLKPMVDLANDPAHWRGEINFGTDEAAWAQWFASYQNFIVHYAQLAQETGVAVFAVGTELGGTAHRESNWRAIIDAVRSVYPGLLTYAANFDGEQYVVNFWDALDFIGIDAYYPLTQKTDPTVEELKAGWAPHKAELATLSQAWRLPIVFTEVGYRSVDGTNRAPWDWISDGPVDLQEQADCYRALFEVFQSEPWMEGIFWWAWGTDPDHGGPDDTYYSPHNKPAEAVLQYFFASAASSPALFRIERATGNVYTDGTFFAGGADVAEYVLVSEPVEPGDVVELDPHNPKHYRKAQRAYSKLVAGVIATAPGLVLNAHESAGDRALLALLGRVLVKATAENGPIRPGDLLTSASTPGYAMRCSSPIDCEGALVGKALTPLNDQTGIIHALLWR
uniref:Hypothetical conserved protein n=2 Tax=Candidatus Bipolaricaulota TaxID=67810 RepID=H5SA01_9BACT|nr:hypothetical conserved protein [uncultured Acetothermia bacterium]BAL60159.1 hypothetical conserved protein [Candidatus Acetothermum autotrophicum]